MTDEPQVPKANKYPRICVRARADLIARFDRLAHKLGITRSAAILVLASTSLPALEKKHGL